MIETGSDNCYIFFIITFYFTAFNNNDDEDAYKD